MLFYMNFLDDNTFQIVKQKHFKNKPPMSNKEVDFNKKYLVAWPPENNPDIFYEACILFVSESEEDLQRQIDNSRPKKRPFKLLQSETDETDESASLFSFKKKKEIYKRDAPEKKEDLKKKYSKEAIKSQQKNIIETKLKKNNNLDENYKIENENLQKDIKNLAEENINLKTENSLLKEEIKKIKKLNYELQENIIKKMEPGTAAPPITDPNVGDIVDKMVYLGTNTFIPKEMHFNILAHATTGTKFVKLMAVAIFGEDTLKVSSVTGQRCKGHYSGSAKPPLDPEKLVALKSIYRHYLVKKGTDENLINPEINKVNLIVSKKISELSRVRKPKKISDTDINVSYEDEDETQI